MSSLNILDINPLSVVLLEIPSPIQLVAFLFLFLFLDFIYLFLEREKGEEKERERNISVCLPLMHPPLRTRPQPRHVPGLGIELATPQPVCPPSIHSATSARAFIFFLMVSFAVQKLFS